MQVLNILICYISLFYIEKISTFPFNDPSLSWDERVEDLVDRLTLDEIVQQSVALYQKSAPAIPRLGIHEYYWVTECIRGYQNRNATVFPMSLGLSSSFRLYYIILVYTLIYTVLL